MPRKALFWAGGAGAVLLLWLLLGRTGAAGEVPDGHAGTSANGTGAGLEADAMLRPPAVRSGEAPGILAVRVRSRGAPAHGTAAVVTGGDFRTLFHSLACTHVPGARDTEEALQLEFAGSFEVPVPAGHWSWVRVWGENGSMAFLRVEPFARRAEREVVLDPDHHSLRVQVYRPDFRTPAAGSRVRLLAAAFGEASFGAERVHVADPTGHLELRGLSPGVHLVVAAGAAPGDGAPHAVRVVLPPPGGREILCTLVEPPRRSAAVVEVLADGIGDLPMLPKLFLRRVDDGSGSTYPQQGTLREGGQTLQFAVPPGSYRPDALPQGILALEGHDGRLEVSEDGSNRFRLLAQAKAPSVTLRLVGPELQHFPLRVFVQPADGLRDDEPEVQFVGPLHWQAASQRVPAFDRPVRLLATGHRLCFASKAPVVLEGDLVAVEMVPATEVAVVWFGWDPVRDAEAVVSVRAGGETVLRRLRPTLAPWFGGGRPALTGSVVVPYGEIEVECMHPDAGVLWRRQTRAKWTRTVVRVEGSAPR